MKICCNRINQLIGLEMFCAILFAASPSLAQDVQLEGGGLSIYGSSTDSFKQPAPNLSSQESQDLHEEGDEQFDRDFSQPDENGLVALGPRFNNVACGDCHFNDGRGEPKFRETGSDLLVRVSKESGTPSVPNGFVPVKGIGAQLQDHGTNGVVTAKVQLNWQFIAGSYKDGSPYTLRKPRLSFEWPKGIAIPYDMQYSLRQSPPMVGLGLLEAVPEINILARANLENRIKDGITGRPNYVWNVVTQSATLGRFGFKAGSPNLKQQTAAAYFNDIGISNPLFFIKGKSPEINRDILAATTFYVSTLGVPMQRDSTDPTVLSGKKMFSDLGCAKCHAMTLKTGNHPIKELSRQTIHPFTDLLLHDMGPGLADHRHEFKASGTEWRTTPLWGIGLTDQVSNGHEAGYLHDGRARTLEEAILWHAGEARQTRQKFRALDSVRRQELITFLRSL
jgi:CxxC motif-containing protein (DUF1111 family)